VAPTSGRPEGAAAPESIARSAPPGAAAPLPRGGHTAPDAPNPQGPSVKRRGDTPGTALIQPSSHQKPHPVGMTLLPAASAVQHSEAEGPVMCSVTARQPARFAPYRIIHSQSCWSAGLLALWRRADLSHAIPIRMWPATTAPDGDSPAFRLVRAYVEPPAESNRRPHPYHGSAAKRRANPRLRRSTDTVDVTVMGSVTSRSRVRAGFESSTLHEWRLIQTLDILGVGLRCWWNPPVRFRAAGSWLLR
jgi:hypothetical protein